MELPSPSIGWPFRLPRFSAQSECGDAAQEQRHCGEGAVGGGGRRVERRALALAARDVAAIDLSLARAVTADAVDAEHRRAFRGGRAGAAVRTPGGSWCRRVLAVARFF